MYYDYYVYGIITLAMRPQCYCRVVVRLSTYKLCGRICLRASYGLPQESELASQKKERQVAVPAASTFFRGTLQMGVTTGEVQS